MKIDWFTVIAQIINFLILAGLLKRYLYKPILKAIDERERLITSQLNDAELKKAGATKERGEFQKKNEDFDQQRREQMNKAIEEVRAERQKLLEEARTETNELRSKLEKALKDDVQNMNHEIVRKTQAEVFGIAKKTLADLASLSLEEQTVKVFIRRLAGLKDEEKRQFISAFGSPAHPVLIRSAFDLPAIQRMEIEKAVKGVIAISPSFQFETEPELVSGIEMTANGYKLAWNISDYLDSIEKGCNENLELQKEVK